MALLVSDRPAVPRGQAGRIGNGRASLRCLSAVGVGEHDVWEMRRVPMILMTDRIVLAVAAGAARRPAGSSASGLYGIVMRGPITPVCREGVPCDAPASDVTLTFSRSGRAWSARTDQRGAYRIRLAPGIYAVRTSAKPFGQTPRPARVRVRAGPHGRLVFTIDTGIR